MWFLKARSKPKYEHIGNHRDSDRIPSWVYRRFKNAWREGDPDQHKYNYGQHTSYGPGVILYFNGKKYRYKFVIGEKRRWTAYRRLRRREKR